MKWAALIQVTMFDLYPAQEILSSIREKMQFILSFICCLNGRIFPQLINDWSIFTGSCRKECI